MQADNMPTFVSGMHSHSTYGGHNMAVGGGTAWVSTHTSDYADNAHLARREALLNQYVAQQGYQSANTEKKQAKLKKEPSMANTTRVVRVFLVDPDSRVPVDKRILYKGDETVTDATDQELFFSIPVADLLTKHNTFREGFEVEERDGAETKLRKLKPIRIRDLTMTVTTVASF